MRRDRPNARITVSQTTQPSGHEASFEFIALMAVMTSIIAFSIDAMLPALPQIAADLGVADVNDRQLVVIVLFIGLVHFRRTEHSFADVI